MCSSGTTAYWYLSSVSVTSNTGDSHDIYHHSFTLSHSPSLFLYLSLYLLLSHAFSSFFFHALFLSLSPSLTCFLFSLFSCSLPLSLSPSHMLSLLSCTLSLFFLILSLFPYYLYFPCLSFYLSFSFFISFFLSLSLSLSFSLSSLRYLHVF